MQAVDNGDLNAIEQVIAEYRDVIDINAKDVVSIVIVVEDLLMCICDDGLCFIFLMVFCNIYK